MGVVLRPRPRRFLPLLPVATTPLTCTCPVCCTYALVHDGGGSIQCKSGTVYYSTTFPLRCAGPAGRLGLGLSLVNTDMWPETEREGEEQCGGICKAIRYG